MTSRCSAGAAGHLGHRPPSQTAEVEAAPVIWRRCTSPGWKTLRVSTRLAPPPCPLCGREAPGAEGGYRGGGRGNCQLCDLGQFLCPSVPSYPCERALSSCWVRKVCCFPVAGPASGWWAGLEVLTVSCSATPGLRPAPAPLSCFAVPRGPLVV